MELTDLEKKNELRASLIKKIYKIESLADLENFIKTVTKEKVKAIIVEGFTELIAEKQAQTETITAKNNEIVLKIQNFLTNIESL